MRKLSLFWFCSRFCENCGWGELRPDTPRPSVHPSGAPSGARPWNGAEMVTAGITDSAPWGRSSPRGQAGMENGPVFSAPQPQPQRTGGHSRSGGPNGPGVASTPAARGWLSSSRGRENPPRTSLGAPPSPNSTASPSPGSNLFSLAGRQRKGCGPGISALGVEAMAPIPRPSPSAKSSRKVAYCPRTCLAGPFSAVAAQISELLPLGPRASPDQSRRRPPSSDC